MTEAHRRILYQDRPASAHPKMELGNRAKLFTPFAALRGFDIAILAREQDRLLVPRVRSCRDQEEEINRALLCLRPGDRVTVRHFLPVRQLGGQELGEYAVETSAFCRIDRDARLLLLESVSIPLENIQEIRLPDNDWGEPA